MPCPRHAEHADAGVQTPQAVKVGIPEHGPLRKVPRHNDSRTAQTSRELVRVEPVPHLPRGKRLKGRRVHVGHVLRTVQGFLWGLPWVDLQQEVGELWNILGDDQVTHPRVLLRSAAESPTAQGGLLQAYPFDQLWGLDGDGHRYGGAAGMPDEDRWLTDGTPQKLRRLADEVQIVVPLLRRPP